MASPVRGKDQCKVRQVQILGQGRKDNGTARAGPEQQDRAMQEQDQDRARTRCSTRQVGHVRGGSPHSPPSPPSRTWAGRDQREGVSDMAPLQHHHI